MSNPQVVTPDKNSKQSKKEQVAGMFDDISPKYDFLNHLLSFGIDIYWRKKVIQLLKKRGHQKVVDIATGTGDLAIAIAQKTKAEKVVGVDISDGMLSIGRVKVKEKALNEKISMENGDSENLPYEDHSFDAATVAFGVRNFENLDKGLKEIHRVIKPGGQFIVLEFSHPKAFPFKQAYGFYSKYILPTVGKIFSKNENAYRYLPESVAAFPADEHFIKRLEKAGFSACFQKRLTFGICSIYFGLK